MMETPERQEADLANLCPRRIRETAVQTAQPLPASHKSPQIREFLDGYIAYLLP